jgi:hypothetical protein
MSELTKGEKLKKILEKVEKEGITSYYIAKHTELKESGLSKLFRGEIKRPHDLTVNTLYNFLYSNSVVKEDSETYIQEKDTIMVGGYEVTLKEFEMSFYKNLETVLKRPLISLIIDGEANKKFKKVLEDNNIEVEYVAKKKTTV